MASVKAILRKKKNKDGLFPITIRISKGEETSFIYLGYYIEEADWNGDDGKVRKRHPNSNRLNNLIAQRISEVEKSSLTLDIEKKSATSLSIKEETIGKASSFFALAATYLQNLKKSGSFNRWSAENPRINRFKEFTKGDITFQNITVPLLKNYQAFLRSRTVKKKKITERTVVNHLIVIRTIFNQAIKGHMVDMKYYPFGRNGIKITFPDSAKIGFNEDEVALLENAQIEQGTAQDIARDMWLVSFYFAGMRGSDVFRFRRSEIHDGRLFYAMGKNDKFGSVKIVPKAQVILDKYIKQKYAHDLVFPALQDMKDMNDKYSVQKRISQVRHNINKALKRLAEKLDIEKPPTMHIARHTFGNIVGDKGISPQLLQKLYRHTSLTTTIGYQANFKFKETDDVLDVVTKGK